MSRDRCGIEGCLFPPGHPPEIGHVTDTEDWAAELAGYRAQRGPATAPDPQPDTRDGAGNPILPREQVAEIRRSAKSRSGTDEPVVGVDAVLALCDTAHAYHAMRSELDRITGDITRQVIEANEDRAAMAAELDTWRGIGLFLAEDGRDTGHGSWELVRQEQPSTHYACWVRSTRNGSIEVQPATDAEVALIWPGEKQEMTDE